MPHVYWDDTNKRYFIERRVPRDVRAIIGGGRSRYHKFKQGVSHEEANALSFGIVQRWQAEWNAVRPRPQVPVYPGIRLSLDAPLTLEAAALIHCTLASMCPGLPIKWENMYGVDPALVDEPQDGSDPVYPGEAPAMKLGSLRRSGDRKVFPYPQIIPVWATYRQTKGVETSEEDRKDALRKLARLFRFLDHDDMNRVSGPDLDRYVADDLLAKGSSIKEASGYRDHAVMLRSLFRRAFEKELIDQDPTAGRLAYTRRTGKRRDIFRPEQYWTIMLAARECDDPVIRITALVMGFSGLRPHELVEASTADFRWDDGELRFNIRTDNRVGDEASIKTPDSERFLTIHSAIRDLVWAHVEQRRAVLGGEGRLFDLPRYGGRSNRAATNRIGLWLRKIEGLTLEPRQSFYSLRHNAVTEFERMALNGKITETLAAFLTGHSTGKTVRGSIYIHRSKEVAAAIENLPNPFRPVGAAQDDSVAAPPLVEAAQPLRDRA